MKTGKFTRVYAASTSRGIHVIASNKVCKLRVASPAECKLTYLQFAGEFTRGVIADCLQLQAFFCAFAGLFACDCAGTFTCDSCVSACKLHVFLLAKASNFALVPNEKLYVKYPLYSSKFTRGCRKVTCILREVLAALTLVNLSVFTSKLQVTHVNCVWDLFTCELQVKLPAFAGNFARVSFTVYSLFNWTSWQKLLSRRKKEKRETCSEIGHSLYAERWLPWWTWSIVVVFKRTRKSGCRKSNSQLRSWTTFRVNVWTYFINGRKIIHSTLKFAAKFK